MPSNAAPPAPVPVATPTDGVTWVEVGAMHHQAFCTCNWSGPRPAAVDALLHAAANGGVPAAPLRRTTILRPHAAHEA
ncbi:hypothetical protein MI149_29890 (plasmid) [Mycolicibacterium crocinum]|uniref:Uncharacterized protein n=1 Tax=Mycolicibacterium crocinum TaxID=388459 RepID=A0ABY3TTD4_9MYCO|nr:hypothetical protein [Mycolicibacterium crocinum]ULN44708.1 hypothetical protein MI149_29890 [Mycolicibacterium crocinum]